MMRQSSEPFDEPRAGLNPLALAEMNMNTPLSDLSRCSDPGYWNLSRAELLTFMGSPT
jgi:hypothetical protein